MRKWNDHLAIQTFHSVNDSDWVLPLGIGFVLILLWSVCVSCFSPNGTHCVCLSHSWLPTYDQRIFHTKWTTKCQEIRQPIWACDVTLLTVDSVVHAILLCVIYSFFAAHYSFERHHNKLLIPFDTEIGSGHFTKINEQETHTHTAKYRYKMNHFELIWWQNRKKYEKPEFRTDNEFSLFLMWLSIVSVRFSLIQFNAFLHFISSVLLLLLLWLFLTSNWIDLPIFLLWLWVYICGGIVIW